jgi:hypothetical protein
MLNISYTRKQMGDACEMLVAAELTLAGNPAAKFPDNWPQYDLAVRSKDGSLQTISVKSRTFKRGGDTFVAYNRKHEFDWLAIVLLPGDGETRRRIFVIPRDIADQKARKDSEKAQTTENYYRQDEVETLFSAYENNFRLSSRGCEELGKSQ